MVSIFYGCNSSGRIVIGRRRRTGCGGAGEPSRRHLSRTESALSRTLCRRYGAERGKRRCPFPRAPIPETNSDGSQAAPLPCRQSSLEARLAEYENPAFSHAWYQGTFVL